MSNTIKPSPEKGCLSDSAQQISDNSTKHTKLTKDKLGTRTYSSTLSFALAKARRKKGETYEEIYKDFPEYFGNLSPPKSKSTPTNVDEATLVKSILRPDNTPNKSHKQARISFSPVEQPTEKVEQQNPVRPPRNRPPVVVKASQTIPKPSNQNTIQLPKSVLDQGKLRLNPNRDLTTPKTILDTPKVSLHEPTEDTHNQNGIATPSRTFQTQPIQLTPSRQFPTKDPSPTGHYCSCCAGFPQKKDSLQPSHIATKKQKLSRSTSNIPLPLSDYTYTSSSTFSSFLQTYKLSAPTTLRQPSPTLNKVIPSEYPLQRRTEHLIEQCISTSLVDNLPSQPHSLNNHSYQPPEHLPSRLLTSSNQLQTYTSPFSLKKRPISQDNG
ncbi:hypothetical protein BLNAU_11612 [Blattamonas nauphoetae]|uniref:Uncharacterized protein n=1 Tax=Blattamonas nauphoetae TaxID=2049346 RepID=A0ABQ9XQ12_9EUKA|nr:hypothetical protein BLNAU_11612 [Blattamonas nauphoetae]